MNSTLFLVPVPMGNYKDITLRALDVLQNADIIICEEYKEARRLFAKLNIEPKELLSVNEHNEEEDSGEIINRILSVKNSALISDAGSPVFSDPGNYLVSQALERNINVVPLPGANSVITALIGSGLNLNSFYFAGWLPQKKDLRKEKLRKLKTIKELIVLMETPYRLKKLLAEVNAVFGKEQSIVLAYNLTMEDEKFFRGKIGKILKFAEEKNLKGAFILMIENRRRI